MSAVTEVILAGEETLDTLAAQIRDELSTVERSAWRVGELLAAARQLLPGDREFGRWCSANFAEEIPTRTLYEWRALYDSFGQCKDDVKHIPKSGLYLLAAPQCEDIRWEVVAETREWDRVTVDAVETRIKELTKSPTHVSHNSGENDWYTPPAYIEAAREVMGGIDMDPASSELANTIVQAPVYYTAQTNGLNKKWAGRVWMNPPYSKDLVHLFTAKLLEHLVGGDINAACVLVNNATDTGWCQPLLKNCNAVCFPKGRVKFIDKEGTPSGAPLQGQAIFYFGEDPESFREHFGGFGAVLFP